MQLKPGMFNMSSLRCCYDRKSAQDIMDTVEDIDTGTNTLFSLAMYIIRSSILFLVVGF